MLSDPRLPGWLAAGQHGLVGDLSDRAKKDKLGKLDAEIAAVSKEHLAALKEQGIAEVVAEYAEASAYDR